MRGPNWNFFGPYEHWDAHKVEALDQRQSVGVSLGTWSHMSLPATPACWLPGSSAVRLQIGYIIWSRVARNRAGAGLFHRLAASDGADGVPQVLSADGLHSLHGDGQLAAVYGVAADQDGAALGI